MALTVVTGRANAGKTGVMYGAVIEAVRAGQQPVLLLPTRPDVTRATAELAERVPVGPRAARMDEWVAEVWSLFGDGRRIVEPEQRSYLVSHVIAAARLRSLAASASTPGFARLVTELARSAAEERPEALDDARPHSAGDREIVRLLRSYREELGSLGLIEPAAAARLLAADPPILGGRVVAHRFSDLTPSQEALLVALAARHDVYVSLPWEEGFPATEALDGLVARLVASGEHRHLRTDKGQGELARLEACLFREPRPTPPQGAVQFCRAAGEEAEAALIAERAAEAARRFGPDRVAIVFRDAARHVERVRVALAGAGVPADIDVLVPFGRTPYGGAVVQMLTHALGHGERDTLTAFLRCPFSGAAHEDVDRLDAAWRGEPDRPRERILSDAVRLGPATGHALTVAHRLTSAASLTLGDWQELAGTLLRNAHDEPESWDDQDAAVDAAAHRALLEVVSRLAVVPGQPASCADVLAALEATSVPMGAAERPGHVQVTEAHRLRGRRFDAVIVGGLTAGDFSAEGRASVAGQIGARILGTQRPSEQAAERLLFYMVCTRARRLLVLTRQTAGSGGEPRRPSVFWEEALDLYRKPDADAEREAEDAVVADTVRLSDLERAAPALSPGRARLRADAVARAAEADGHRGTRLSERLSDPEILAWLRGRDEFSATELETYARCPFRWFYERAVRPEALDAAFDALTRGDLAHRALARFYGELWPAEREKRVTPGCLARALEVADEAFDQAWASMSTSAITIVEQDEVVRTRARVRALIAEDATFLESFEPRHFELRFGTASPDPGATAAGGRPTSIHAGPVDLGGFLIKGSVDRIDEGREGLVVIDYKTGAAPKRADIERERRIQVPLYAAAARALLGEPVVAGLYRSLRDGGARGFFRGDLLDDAAFTSTDAVKSQDEFDAIVEASVAIARGAAEGIREGLIPARPVSENACRYCAAASVCGGGGAA